MNQDKFRRALEQAHEQAKDPWLDHHTRTMVDFILIIFDGFLEDEKPTPSTLPPYQVKLTIFRRHGKYYTHGEYISDKEYMHEIFSEVVDMRRRGELPGLVNGHETNEYVVLVDIPNHPNNYPHLIGLHPAHASPSNG